MKPEVSQIFDDLDKWLDYCRFNMLPFNPADLYKSKEWRDFNRFSNGGERRPYLGKKPRFENKNNDRFSR